MLGAHVFVLSYGMKHIVLESHGQTWHETSSPLSLGRDEIRFFFLASSGDEKWRYHLETIGNKNAFCRGESMCALRLTECNFISRKFIFNASRGSSNPHLFLSDWLGRYVSSNSFVIFVLLLGAMKSEFAVMKTYSCRSYGAGDLKN